MAAGQNRVAILLGASALESRIIEIGPSYAPVAPKAAGWHTHVVDHVDQTRLRIKYQDAGVPVDRIEPVDSIWDRGQLDQAVPEALHGRFDRLIASHVIEHLPDPAGFLNAAARLLKPESEIALAVPDKRFCFDYFRTPSTTGEMIEAYFCRRSSPAPRDLWNQLAYSVTADEALAWPPGVTATPRLMAEFSQLKALLPSFAPSAPALHDDCHIWRFTPAGFTLVLFELGQLGIIDWHLHRLEYLGGFEFFAILRRGVPELPDMAAVASHRLDLLGRQQREQYEHVELAKAAERPFRSQAPGPDDAAALFAQLEQQGRRLTELEQVLARLHGPLARAARVLRKLGLRRRTHGSGP